MNSNGCNEEMRMKDCINLKKKIQSKIQINVDVDENQRLEKSQRFFLLAILLELVHVYILRCSKVRTA